MSHTPFILAAYSFGVVLLTWCAFAPVVRARRLKQEILHRIELTGKDDASNS